MINKLTAIYNLSSKKWSISKDLHPTNDFVINIGFEKDGHDIIHFNGLKFGFQLYRITNPSLGLTDLVATRDFPFPKTKIYLHSETKIVEVVDDVELSIFDDFRIDLYAEESGEKTKIAHEFSTPMPTQPYPSWLWNGLFWEPPIPLPEDSEVVSYRWDESMQNWTSDKANPNLAFSVGLSEHGSVDNIVE